MPRVVKFFQENHAHEREESVRFFEAGVKEGLFRKDVDFNVVMDIGHVMMEEIMHHQLYRVHSMQEIYDKLYFVPDSWILYRARLRAA